MSRSRSCTLSDHSASMPPLSPVLKLVLASFPLWDAYLLARLSSAVDWELPEPSLGPGTKKCILGGLPFSGERSVSNDPQNNHSEL